MALSSSPLGSPDRDWANEVTAEGKEHLGDTFAVACSDLAFVARAKRWKIGCGSPQRQRLGAFARATNALNTGPAFPTPGESNNGADASAGLVLPLVPVAELPRLRRAPCVTELPKSPTDVAAWLRSNATQLLMGRSGAGYYMGATA